MESLVSTIVTFVQTNHTHKRLTDMQEKQHAQEVAHHEETLKELRALRERQSGVQQVPVILQPMQQGTAPAYLVPQQAPVQTAIAEPESVEEMTEEPKKPYSKYAPDMDVSIGCVPCTRAHLATITASLKDGDAAAAREEMTALLEYDLTPEKLAKTPETERRILEKYAAEIDRLNNSLTGPNRDLTVASASLKEALRFAREDGVTHPEVQERMARTEEAINKLERVTLAPEKLQGMDPEEAEKVREALPEIRKARQDLVNHVRTPEDLEDVTARIAVLDKKLNPTLSDEQLKEVQEQAKKLNMEFRKDVLQAWKGDTSHE